MKLIICLLFGVASLYAQTANPQSQSVGPPKETKPSPLTQSEISQLQRNADAGEANAQEELGRAYQEGNGVAKNPTQAAKWYQKAAAQGNAGAENDLGVLYLTGEGVTQDKQEAVRWFAKAAKGRSPQAMFNLGASYYNGDGVAENEFMAYAWFLLAQEAGNPVADDAVKRSAETMTKPDRAAAYLQIGEMYDKGEQLPKDDDRALVWIRKAAEDSSRGKVALAVQLLRGPDGPKHYGEAMNLCKVAAADFVPANNCVAQMYRKGMGVNRNPAEALKWFKKAAETDASAAHELAQMYLAGEGTKPDRLEAFVLFLRASLLGMKGSGQEAYSLWQQMDQSEQKKVANKMRELRIDPDKMIAALQKQGS